MTPRQCKGHDWRLVQRVVEYEGWKYEETEETLIIHADGGPDWSNIYDHKMTHLACANCGTERELPDKEIEFA